ncbi:MAG: glycosyltransferase family 2 protein [Candidatus Moranbacteria bacterium]|nr:glycosyltransferase family 2 protein [Candidatus Moranbacteria bacterium]
MILIVNIPAYNEEKVIAGTIERIKKSFNADFYQKGEGRIFQKKMIQVIDDGSSDKTAELAKKANADLVISHETNRKLGIAFKTGTENALKNQADIMVNIDADGQFDPEDIPKLIKPILEGESDMVIANRFGEHEAKDIPWVKEFLNRFAARIIGFFLNHRIEDLTCGFRAHNKETLLRLNIASTFTYTQETIIDAIGKNLKLKWVPVKVTYFADRDSKMVKSVWKFINNSSKIILKAIRDVRPLKFFGWPGLFFVFLALIGFGFFFINYIQTLKISPYLNYIFFSSISLLLGIQLLVFALIADMIRSNRKITEEISYSQKKNKYYK